MLILLATALAQDASSLDSPGMDVQRFRPHADHYGYSVVESAATLRNLQVGTGLWLYYAQDELVLVDVFGERTLGESGVEKGDGVIDQRSAANLQVGIGLTRWFSMSADLPIVLWQEGWRPPSADGTTDLVSSGAGDLRLRPKFVALDLDEHPVGIAFLGQVNVPTGDTRSFIGEGEVSAEPLAIVEVADGSIHAREYRIRGAVNLGARLRSPSTYKDVVLGNEFVYRFGVGAHPSEPVELGVDVFGAVGGTRTSQHALETQFWVKLLARDVVSLTAGGGFGLLPGLGSPDMRFFLGGTLAPNFDPNLLDRDGDGVPNKFDDCINIPEDIDGWEDEDGCPEEDNDGDGLIDPLDRCPIVAEDIDGWEDDDGCPDVDNDNDGILDVDDRCPDVSETFNGHEDEDGCPDAIPKGDTDQDGYPDDKDRCPYDPEDFDGFEDEDGCPELDNDFDGIFDLQDKCPLEKETYNGHEDEDGCPDEFQRVIVERSRIRITEKIFFEYNRAEIKVLSYELLNEIAQVILDHPDLKKIRIEGHTDWDGDDSYNLRLSQSRAESVVDFLVNAGVERQRLDPAGFGESRPIADNETEEGRAMNRRVEFLIIERD